MPYLFECSSFKENYAEDSLKKEAVSRLAILARPGVHIYTARELSLSLEGQLMVAVFRPKEEIFSPETIESFEGAPVTIDHPPAGEDIERHRVGFVRNIREKDGLLEGEIVLEDKHAQSLLSKGRRELSIGYTFSLEHAEGVSDEGEFYKFVQRNIKGDHVALVEEGRCGCACCIDNGLPLEPQDRLEEVQDVINDKSVKKASAAQKEEEVEKNKASSPSHPSFLEEEKKESQKENEEIQSLTYSKKIGSSIEKIQSTLEEIVLVLRSQIQKECLGQDTVAQTLLSVQSHEDECRGRELFIQRSFSAHKKDDTQSHIQ